MNMFSSLTMAVSRKYSLVLLLLTAALAVSEAAKASEPRAAAAKSSEAKVPTTKSVTGAKKILALIPVAAPSHHNIFSALLNELLARGHYVTVVSSRAQNTKHPRLREILFPDPFEEFLKNMGSNFLQKRQSTIENIVMMYLMGELLNKAVLDNPEALALKTEKFDLVMTETYFFQEPLLAFAHHFGCPAMTVNPFGYSSQLNEFTGGATNPAYVPNIFGGGTQPDSFLERLSNTVFTVLSMLSYHCYYYPKVNAMMHKAFPDAPPLYDLMTNVSLTLINNHASLMHPVALAPSVIEVGGIHIKPGKPLPADLKKWIEDSKYGIVYFSFGSNLKTAGLPEEKRKALFTSFGKLKQRVLLKWDAEIPADAPKNCRFEKWVPQQEVLMHPKLKVFITHGGLLSTQESVYFGAAIVGMPIFGDQAMNMEMAIEQGFGQMVSFYELTSEALDAALNEVIHNPKYRENSRKLSVRFRSDPILPLEKAVYYTELLMELGDLKHLQPSSVHLRWYQYLLLDVMAVIALGLYVIWRIIRFICSTCFGCCCKSSKAKKD